jgi:UDP-N-acetylmuramyl tripeptide synthase
VNAAGAAPSGVPTRTMVAARAGRVTAGLSRLLGRGDGTVIGGRVSLWVDPDALARLGAGRWVSLVSGTNGKTTTTRLLTAALALRGPVATNPQGSNLPPGLVAGLGRSEPGAAAALEVDEAWLGTAADALRPATFTLLNLTRDQLDRVAEVRRLADRWRAVVAAHPETHVVANADDPLVVWAAAPAATVTWVGAGQPWLEDAAGCPSCGDRIRWGEAAGIGAWACSGCGFARPDPAVWVDGDDVVAADGGRHPLHLALPGRANRANAAMAAVTATRAGVGLGQALAAMTATVTVDGRYRQATVGESRARLLLAKNPAGWLEVFDMLAPPPGPVVVVINARIADGRDPSWLWDVPFERLAGRRVAASGERSRDLAVRLDYAEVEYRHIPDPVEAIAAVGPGPVDVAANYTALRDLDARLRRPARSWRAAATGRPRPSPGEPSGTVAAVNP